MSDNQAVVRDFIAAFHARDIDHIMTFFCKDAVYHNIPVAPVTGPTAIRAVLQGFMGMADDVEFVTHHLAETHDGVVLSERTDRFHIKSPKGDKWLELPVMGTFELRDGRISAWRDYFDMQQFQSQLPG